MLLRRAEFHSGVHAPDQQKDRCRAEGVGEELEELQHGGHVAPVVRAACDDHVVAVETRSVGIYSLANGKRLVTST